MAAPVIVQYAVNNGPGQVQQQQAAAVFQAFASNTVAGNAIVAFYTMSDFAGTHFDGAAADTQGNSYSSILNQQNTSQTGGSQTVVSFVAANIAGGADTVHTFLSTSGDSEDFQANFILEVGNVIAAPLAGHIGQTQNALAPGSNNLLSGNITLSAAQVPCILIGIAINSSGTVPPSVGTGMTLLTTTWNYGSGGNLATVAYRNITTPGTYQAVFNQADTVNVDCACLAVALQSTPGAALASTAGATATVAAVLKTAAGFAARVAATATLMASFVTPVLSPVNAAGVSKVTASLTTGITLSSASLGTSGVTSNLSVSTPSGLSFGASASAHTASITNSLSTVGVTTQNNSGFIVGVQDRYLSPNTPATITDNMGNTYLPLGSPRGLTRPMTMGLWWCPQGIGGPGHTVTAHPSAYADISLYFQEIVAANGLGIALDQLIQTYDTTSPYTSDPMTTSQLQEVLVAFFGGYSVSNPATLAVSGGTLVIKASCIDGSASHETVGCLAGAVVTAQQTGLQASFTQAGNTGDGAIIFASFTAVLPPGNLFCAGAGTATVSGNLSTGAGFASTVAGTSSVTAALTNWASVVLVQDSTPNNIMGMSNPTNGYATTPSAAANQITGDIDFIACVQPPLWATGGTVSFISKYNGTGNQVAYKFCISNAGNLVIQTSVTGSVASVSGTSTTNVGSPGVAAWVRGTLQCNDGAGNRVYKFYVSNQPPNTPLSQVVWIQLGATVTTAGTTSIFASTATLQVGARQLGLELFNGTVYHAYVCNGIGTPPVVSFEPSGDHIGQLSWTSRTGETWTVVPPSSIVGNRLNKVGSVYDPYLWLDADPVPGDTVYYDPTNITIMPAGDIVASANNISAVVQFNDGIGMTQGLIQITSGEVALAYAVASVTANLGTIPNAFATNAGGVASVGGTLTTQIPLVSPSLGTASVTGALNTGVALASQATAVTSVTCATQVVAFFTSSSSGVATVVGALSLRQSLAASGGALTSVSGNLTHGVLFTGGGGGCSTVSGTLTTAKRLASLVAGSAFVGAVLTTQARFVGAVTGVATVQGVATLRQQLSGSATGVASVASAIRTGSGFASQITGLTSAQASLRIGVGLRANVGALVSSRAAISVAALFASRLGAVASFGVNLTTLQSPVGMYIGDPNLVVDGDTQPVFWTIGPTEQLVLTFDFLNGPGYNKLVGSETLVGVAAVTVENTAGNDPTPVDVLNGPPSFNVGQTQVLVPVTGAGGLLNNDYYIIVACATSNPQKVLDRFGVLQIRS